MKGGYAPVPQDNQEGIVTKTNQHRTKRSCLRCVYLLVLVAVCVTGAATLWYIRSSSGSKDDVIKPLYDRKIYKAITLSNAMRVLLIQDKDTILSGMGLDVQVGSMSDLEAGPVYFGLAHFTEHAMYMGSKDFPKFNELANFLQVHGGNDNAFTTQTHTNFYFYVNSRSIEHSIKIFSASFRSPLFNPEVLEGEKQAIQNELEKDIPQTTWKKFSILKKISDTEHPFHRFNVGNKEIFDSADFVTKIRWFYNKYYSSNMMTLVLLSNLPIVRQEEVVRRHFSTLPNRNVSKPTYFSNPYPRNSKYINQYIVYENGALNQQLELLFPIASTREEMYLDHKVIITILGDESNGTVTSHLRDLGYIIGLTVSTLTFPESFSCLTIQIHLTSIGCCKVKEIIKTVFDYLEILKREITKSVWKDNYNLRKIRFNYHDEADIKTLLKTLPGWMASASSPQYYLSSQLLQSKYSKADLQTVLSKLGPDNINVLQGGGGFDLMKCTLPVLSLYDDTFKSNYAAQRIPDTWIRLWQDGTKRTEGLSMPPKNVYIPQDFTIVADSAETAPLVTLDEDGFKAYWLQDSSLPKSYVNCKFYIPHVAESARSVAVLRLYLGVVSESLDTITYTASSAEYRHILSPLAEGFKLKIEGFSDRDTFFKFLKLVVRALRDPTSISDMRYKYQVQEMINDELNRIYNDQPFRQGFYLSRLFFQTKNYDNRQLTSYIMQLSQQEILELGRAMLENLAIKCFTFGNHDNQESRRYVQFIRDQFISHILKSSYAYRGTVVELPAGRWVWQLPVLNPTETNNCIFLMNQISTSTTSGPSLRKHILLTLLGTIMKDPAYATLRTEEHLGYTVFTGSLRMMNVDFLYLLLQGSHYTPDSMMTKVVEFLHSYRDVLAVLVAEGTSEYGSGDEWFKTTKMEAINHILSRPESQVGMSDYYAEISQSSWPFFNKGEYLITAARDLHKAHLLDFYDTYIIGNSRQLIIQLHGAGYDIQNTTLPHTQILPDLSDLKLEPVNVNFVW